MVQLAFVVAFLTIVTSVCLFFRTQNKKQHTLYVARVADLQQKISKEKNHIAIREEGLNKYDFLKYNLSESLLIQNNIKV